LIGCRLDDRGLILLFAVASIASIPVVGLTQFPVGNGIKRPRCEANHSPDLVPRLRMRGAVPPLARTPS